MKKTATKQKSNKKIKPLSINRIISYHIDSFDLDRFIKDIYGKEFTFVHDQESANYSSHEFQVSKKKLDELDQKELEKFIKDGDYSFSAQVIMNDLCNKGLIKSGHYIVRVCW